MINLQMLTIRLLVIFCVFAGQDASAQSENNLSESDLPKSDLSGSDLFGQLRADYAALLDASAEFDRIEKSGNINSAASSNEQADYAAWIRQLSMQFAESCQRVSRDTNRAIPADIPCAEFSAGHAETVKIDIEQESTDNEKTAAMAGRLNGSLGDFDEKLLREQDRVEARRPRTASTGSGGGAGNDSQSSAGSGGESMENGEAAQEGQQSDQQGDTRIAGSDQTATDVQGAPPGGRQANIPDDIPDGSNDDVIARQLREAAEKETDPELREKLWEEYKRYKNG